MGAEARFISRKWTQMHLAGPIDYRPGADEPASRQLLAEAMSIWLIAKLGVSSDSTASSPASACLVLVKRSISPMASFSRSMALPVPLHPSAFCRRLILRAKFGRLQRFALDPRVVGRLANSQHSVEPVHALAVADPKVALNPFESHRLGAWFAMALLRPFRAGSPASVTRHPTLNDSHQL